MTGTTSMPAHSGSSAGPSIDSAGTPVIDPTKNVDTLVAAAVKRLDDIATVRETWMTDRFNRESAHVRELMTIRAQYEEMLRQKESERLNAIRAVDVSAVAEASRVATAQATTLATQVATSAETLRTQVSTVASATSTALGNALEPLQKAIEDLRKTQYEQQGQKAAQNEGRDTGQWAIGLMIGVFSFIGSVGIAILLHYMK